VNLRGLRLKGFWLVLIAASTLSSGSLRAQARLDFPEEDPGPPYYARIHGGFVTHTDQWAAIVFYRQPSCVPTGFNLLKLFDPPAAFFCTLTVEGFEVFDQAPPPPGTAPKQAKTFGLGAVPVWFVSWPELQAAMADGVLTITELQTLPSLRVGSAGFFRETLHPSEAAQHPELTIVASGTTSAGQDFFFQVSANGDPLSLKNVMIQFK
jgi:hypothetical protein